MTKNIKEIGKELLGKSLNSYHRRTGLTQLEKNNEMQDVILNGILSQVDDAYIEKTEQSNVIHLDGSGDGVVVLDSIEGNTMVNLCNKTTHTIIGENSNNWNKHIYLKRPLVVGNKYTLIINVKSYTLDKGYSIMGRVSVNQNTEVQYGLIYTVNKAGIHKNVFTAQKALDMLSIADESNSTSGESIIEDFILLEGDYTNKEINYFEGLQSSFEEKVNDEDKYEIEILSKNRNMIDLRDQNILLDKRSGFEVNSNSSCTLKLDPNGYCAIYRIPVKKGNAYTLSANISNGVDYPVRINDKEITDGSRIWETNLGYLNGIGYKTKTFTATKDFVNILLYKGEAQPDCAVTDIMLTPNNANISFENPKSNKIKLLINEPLRGINDTLKDKLCVKDNRLVIERNTALLTLTGGEDWTYHSNNGNYFYGINTVSCKGSLSAPCLSDKLYDTKEYTKMTNTEMTMYHNGTRLILHLKNTITNVQALKNELTSNPIKVIMPLEIPTYEEVTNEYGEPILLEGYENGTIYIDSTIAPTTSVRYTPNMKSINTLKEVSNNNVMLTTDINDTIIPYMMEVDLMIIEKEMSLFNSLNKNIRKIGEEDMTSMQKRTGEMLERLIKGKSLNEQECKTRVTVYLNAGKITDEQAEELMLLISEIYA